MGPTPPRALWAWTVRDAWERRPRAASVAARVAVSHRHVPPDRPPICRPRHIYSGRGGDIPTS